MLMLSCRSDYFGVCAFMGIGNAAGGLAPCYFACPPNCRIVGYEGDVGWFQIHVKCVRFILETFDPESPARQPAVAKIN
jgi:hypothetical protein